MKQLTFILVLCVLVTSLSAQIQLEHTYDNGFLKRIRMDVSGEKYVLKQPLCHLSLYHADHTPVDDLTLVSGYYGCMNVFFSEHLLDSDDDFEVLFNWFEDGLGLDAGNSVWNNGQEQQLSSSNAEPFVSTGQGISTKLLINTQVFTLPGPVQEHYYGPYNRLKRQVFPVDGERYVTYNWKYFDGFFFYNSDHEPVKSVNLPLPYFDELNDVSQQYFNDDALYEFFGTRPLAAAVDGNYNAAEVVSEDGAVLFSSPCSYAYISAISGLPDRLMLNGYNAPDTKAQKIYDAHTLTLLNTFPFYTERISLDGINGYYVRFSPLKDTLWLYNENFQAVKTVTTATGANWNFGFTRDRFSDSGKLEIFYTTKNGPGLNDTKVVCIDEDGALLYAFPGAKTAQLDQQEGMDDKFFVTYPDSVQVYDFIHQTSGVTNIAPGQNVSLSPNPFSASFELRFTRKGDYTIRLMDMAGRLIRSEIVYNTSQATIETGESVPPGVYFCFISGSGIQQVFRLVKNR